MKLESGKSMDGYRAVTGFLAFTAAIVVCFAVTNDAKADDSHCSPFEAVYKPQGSTYPNVPAAQPKPLSFELRIRKPEAEEKIGSHLFFYIDAFDTKSKTKVSTLRMGDVCSNGASQCSITTSQGRFATNEPAKELEYGLGFEPIALRQDFSRAEYHGADAPHAIVLPDTLQKIYILLNKTPLYPKDGNPLFDETVGQFVRFATRDSNVVDITAVVHMQSGGFSFDRIVDRS